MMSQGSVLSRLAGRTSSQVGSTGGAYIQRMEIHHQRQRYQVWSRRRRCAGSYRRRFTARAGGRYRQLPTVECSEQSADPGAWGAVVVVVTAAVAWAVAEWAVAATAEGWAVVVTAPPLVAATGAEVILSIAVISAAASAVSTIVIVGGALVVTDRSAPDGPLGFQIWYFAAHPEKALRPEMDAIIDAADSQFPKLASLSRRKQKEIGLRVLIAALRDKELMAHPSTDRTGAGSIP